MWEWVQTAGAGGAFAVFVWILWRFHLDAVTAHDKRADSWERAYNAQVALAKELQSQNGLLLQQVLRSPISPDGARGSVTQ